MVKKEAKRPVVWCIFHRDDLTGIETLWHVEVEFNDALNLMASGDYEDFAGTWWTIRPHELGEAVQ